MNDLLIPLVFLLSLVCFIASDPIPQTSATGDEKKEIVLKPQQPAEASFKKSEPTSDKSTEAIGTGTTSSPHICGGLKEFLNLCPQKKEYSSKQKRNLNENEENSEEPDIDPEKEVEETNKSKQEEKRDIPVAPSDEIEVKKRQTEAKQEGEDEEEKINTPNDEMPTTRTPALDKSEAPLLYATSPGKLTSDKSPAPLSSETYLPIPHKRQAKESEEGNNTDETDDDVEDDDNNDYDDNHDDSDENDETEKR